MIEERKKNIEQKILLMKENALNDIKKVAIGISIQTVESLVKNSIDKNKIENFFNKSIEETKNSLKQTKTQLEWDPSQNGGCLVSLHPQKKISLLSVATYFNGLNLPSCVCDPSQKGCLFDSPQEHQK